MLSACSATGPPMLTEIEIVEVPVLVYKSLDEELVAPCLVPTFSKDTRITFGNTVTYSAELLGVVEECNNKLSTIRGLTNNDGE